MEYLEQLHAESFAAMVYWIYIIGVIMILVCLLERAHRISKRWVLLLVFFPPLLALFIIKNWDLTKGPCAFFAGFYFVILFTGALSGYHMADFTIDILIQIFLWPWFFSKWLLENNAYLQHALNFFE
jgi:hypothetical protein